MIIDTPFNVQSKIPCLQSQGVQTVIRYYNFSNTLNFPDKRLELAEAQAISASGMQLAVVFQQRQNQAADFDALKGAAAGKTAYRYAKNNIGQPAGSAIYFSVDFDASKAEIKNNIIPYFDAVKNSFLQEGNGSSDYRIGTYGSGLTCETLTSKNLIELTWLAMSRGFSGTADALKSGNFHLAQRFPSMTICGLDVDVNDANQDQRDFGAFVVDADHIVPATPSVAANRQKVIARHGLRLREGPGTQFDIIGNLRPGQIVFVQSTVDGFARIDVDGDGQADGFASAGLLEKV